MAVTGVTLDKTTLSVAVGASSDALVATVAPATATNKAVTWASDNEKVATVADGVVTGVKAGTANITAKTADGGKTATCAATVA
ncbi:Ig domain-containing protein [Pantoea sp. Bo_2]|uniref:Ig-like domain-containing protein n=1 Tax=unclassified Pantoea TaxID=2630326 RepID=UPI00351A1F03